jgi:hypothetical protein
MWDGFCLSLQQRTRLRQTYKTFYCFSSKRSGGYPEPFRPQFESQPTMTLAVDLIFLRAVISVITEIYSWGWLPVIEHQLSIVADYLQQSISMSSQDSTRFSCEPKTSKPMT